MICEILMIAVMFLCGVYVVYTDLKRGIVENKALFITALIGILLDIIYYCGDARYYLNSFLLNYLLVSSIAVLLYSKHYWAAGDTKLLMCISLFIPGRLYDQEGVRISGLIFIMIIFLIAYIYIIIDSLIQWKNKESVIRNRKFNKSKVPDIIKNYIMIYLIIRNLSVLYEIILGDLYKSNIAIFSLLNIVLVSLISESQYLKNKITILIMVGIYILSFIFYGGFNRINVASILKSYGIVVLILLLRYFVEGYNYKSIPTKSVEKGMVLSYTTVLFFQNSTIKGLPVLTTEDMRSRITVDEAQAIKRWGESNKGRSEIVIVRKIPFAIFIVLGALFFIMLRVLL